MTTRVPRPPERGVNQLIVGGGLKVKMMALVATPPGVRSWIRPERLPLPATAVVRGGTLTTTDAAGTPPIQTALVRLKLLPLRTRRVPVLPVAGVNERITGA